MLDFQGVAEIGQAFADELFRVYAREHPDVELVPLNFMQQIERMWLRAVGNDISETPKARLAEAARPCAAPSPQASASSAAR